MSAQEEFMRELSALTRKHGVEIGGCGCCGSPFLMEQKSPGVYRCKDGDDGEELRFDSVQKRQDDVRSQEEYMSSFITTKAHAKGMEKAKAKLEEKRAALQNLRVELAQEGVNLEEYE